MPLRAILLFFLAAGTTSTAMLHHFPLAITSSSVPGANKIIGDAQSTDHGYSGQKQPLASQKNAKQQAQTQTFKGTVEWEYKPLAWDWDVPNCDHFALYDDATETIYELDDARAALPYEGKIAIVTGTVNTKDAIIHVLSIQAAK